jgi:hypothetical protein
MNRQQGRLCFDFQSHSTALRRGILPAVKFTTQAIENEVRNG